MLCKLAWTKRKKSNIRSGWLSEQRGKYMYFWLFPHASHHFPTSLSSMILDTFSYQQHTYTTGKLHGDRSCTFLFMSIKCSLSVEVVSSTVGTLEASADLVRRSQVHCQVCFALVDTTTQLADELKQHRKQECTKFCELNHYARDLCVDHKRHIKK